MKTKWLMAVFMAAVLSLTNGCFLLVIGAAAGVGAAVYVNGELKDTESVSYDNAHAATLAALKDEGFTVVSDQKDNLTADITARGAGDKKVEVKLTKQSDTATEIRIRVSTFGDQNQSQQILDKIKSHF